MNMFISWWKLLVSRRIRLIFVIIGFSLCYISFGLGYNHHKNCQLSRALTVDSITSDFVWLIASYSACITVAVPVLIDSAMDLFHTKKLNNFYERFGIVFGVVCIGFVVLISRNFANHTGLYIASYYAQRMLIGCSIMSCLHTHVPNVFTDFWVLFLNIWIIISQVINCYMVEEDYFVAGVLEICGFVVLIGLLCYWICGKVNMFSIFQCNFVKLTSACTFTADDFIASLYVYSYLLILIFQNIYYYSITGFNNNEDWSHVDNSYLCMYALSTCMYVVVITILPGHVSRAHGQNLQSDLNVKHQYVQHMAHKLVEPLNVIDRGLHSLSVELDESNVKPAGLVAGRRNSTDGSEAYRTNFNEYQATLQRTSCEMNRILKNLLEDTVQVAAVVDVVLVGEFIKEACSPFKHACSVKHLTLNVLVGCDVSCLARFIKVDKIKLTQALREFVSNSMKFTPNGGVITVSASILSGVVLSAGHRIADVLGPGKALEQFLLIKVIDTGEGIPPEILECVFNEPIKKTTTTGSHQQDKLSKGGMSLLVVKNIVELHEGCVWVESEGIGCGCTIFIQLPVMDLLISTENS